MSQARNLTPNPATTRTTTPETPATETQQQPERPKRERKPIGPGSAVDRVLALRAAFAADCTKARLLAEAKLRDRYGDREDTILDCCTDPEAARRMLAAREGE